jgi:hypothetical protein
VKYDRIMGIYLLGLIFIGAKLMLSIESGAFADNTQFRFWERVFFWYASPALAVMAVGLVVGIVFAMWLLLFGEDSFP